MRYHLLILLTALPPLLTGCQSYVPVSVQVLDADTGAAVVGARIRSKIGYGMTPFPPRLSTAVTDRRGRGVVNISDTSAASSRGATAASPGYLEAVEFFPPGRFKQLRRERRPSRAVAASPTADMVIELYREPHPYFVFVVPNGYRGLLRLDQAAPTTERVLSPRERAVEVNVRPPAPQKLPWCRLGRHFIDRTHFTARYDDGTLMPSATRDGGEVALRYVVAHNMRYIYLIGTDADVQAARARVPDLFQDFDKLWEANDASP